MDQQNIQLILDKRGVDLTGADILALMQCAMKNVEKPIDKDVPVSHKEAMGIVGLKRTQFAKKVKEGIFTPIIIKGRHPVYHRPELEEYRDAKRKIGRKK